MGVLVARAVPYRVRQTKPYGSACFADASCSANTDANCSRSTGVDVYRVAHAGAVEHVHSHTARGADTHECACQPHAHPYVDACPDVRVHDVAQAKADL